MELAEHVAESGLGQEQNHSPNPDDESRDRSVANDEHPVIIIGGLQDLRTALEEGGLLDEVVDRALQEPLHEEGMAPAVLRLLMRRYASTGRADLEAAIGPALALAIESCASGVAPAARSDWILLFVEAAGLSPEERLRTAVASLLVASTHDWPAVGEVASAMRSIDSCLRAVDLVSDSDAARRLIAGSIDELERIVGPCYRPREGIAHAIDDPSGARGNLRDQVNTAAALLTAHEITGRLPYSMLAEELMQRVRRFHRETANVESGPLDRERFIGWCEAVRVLCRVALLHEDADYQQAAVVAPATDYGAEAEHLLQWLVAPQRAQNVSTAAEFGISLSDWLTLGETRS
jgi:hypothetical protein